MAASSLAFGLASGFAMLLVARVLQGIASAFTWSGAFSWILASAPRKRRGELIGSAMGAAVVGALFGPVVGVVAALTGRGATFSALVALAGLLALWCLRLESPSAESRGQCFRAAERRPPPREAGVGFSRTLLRGR